MTATTPHPLRFVTALFLIAIGAPSGSQAAEPVASQSPDVEIDYAVNREAAPLSSVELWHTADSGNTWVQDGLDADKRSPVLFRAPGDGEYGIFLVITNATGPSSQPPTTGTAPQVRVLVDQTPPVVQLHALRLSSSFGQPVVQIRWTAIDTLFTARPIELFYRPANETEWRTMTTEPVANTGRFDWSVPDSSTGAINVRLVARDRGGHVVTSEVQPIDLVSARTTVTPPAGNPNERIDGGSTGSVHGQRSQPRPSVSGSPRARARASELIDEAARRRDRGDARGAIARLRDAVRLDPSRTDAFAEMARLFYGLGEWDRALGAYKIVLQQQPAQREALLGAAMALTQRKDYSEAGSRLRTVLRYNPNDVEAWMDLGDVAIYSGDEVLARDCYTRAAQLDPAATDIIENARKRLALMDEVSRRYKDR